MRIPRPIAPLGLCTSRATRTSRSPARSRSTARRASPRPNSARTTTTPRSQSTTRSAELVICRSRWPARPSWAATTAIDHDLTGAGTGNIALVKTGAGTLTLGGVNTYTGATTIAGGALKLGPTSGVASTAAFTTDDNSGIGTASQYGLIGYTHALA